MFRVGGFSQAARSAGFVSLRLFSTAAQPVTSFHTVTDGTRIAYRVYNPSAPKTPLVLVSGWGFTKDDWFGLAAWEDRPVVAIDNRGIGESAVAPGPYSIDMLAKDVESVINHVGYKEVNLFGVSMGGMIAQHLALTSPDRVNKLVLGCTTHGGKTAFAPDVTAFKTLDNWDDAKTDRVVASMEWIRRLVTRTYMLDHNEKFARVVDHFRKSNRSEPGLEGQMAALSRFNTSKKLPELRIPTLVIHGAEDKVLPPGNANLIAEKIPEAILHIVPNAGHVYWLEDGGHSKKLMKDFFEDSAFTKDSLRKSAN